MNILLIIRVDFDRIKWVNKMIFKIFLLYFFDETCIIDKYYDDIIYIVDRFLR